MEYGGGGAAGAVGVVTYIIAMLLSVGFYVAFAYPLMKIGDKKGFTGWFAWVPILNIVLMLQICDKPIWWIALLFVPCLNFVIAILLYLAFFEAIDKPKWWIVFLFVFPPLVLIPIWQAANE